MWWKTWSVRGSSGVNDLVGDTLGTVSVADDYIESGYEVKMDLHL